MLPSNEPWRNDGAGRTITNDMFIDEVNDGESDLL